MIHLPNSEDKYSTLTKFNMEPAINGRKSMRNWGEIPSISGVMGPDLYLLGAIEPT